MITYRDLTNKSKNVEDLLLSKGILTSPIVGRYKYYQKLVSELSLHWEAQTIDRFWKTISGDKMGFASKELHELSDILENIALTYDDLSEESKTFIKNKIPTILSGTNFTVDETPNNSAARNYQFELRLASKFVTAQYKNISFAEHPDLLVTVESRPYAFECKRILGNPEKKISSNIEAAIDQLRTNSNAYYSGVVAVDLSPQYEQGKNWLVSKSREEANKIALDSLEQVANSIYRRMSKIKRSAEDGILVGIILNLSTVYVISSNNELGWLQEIGVLLLNKENPEKGTQFFEDVKKLQKYTIP